MNDQKIENLLNLALDVTETEREKSESLDVGYDAETRTWQVIVRYHGDLLKTVRSEWEVTLLTGGYAIVRLPQTEVNLLASLPEIEYVEKPKLLYFSVDQGRASSCVSALQTPQYDLLGTGLLVAVIDSGVDYFHPDFRNEDGSSRILAIWDQTACNTGALPSPGSSTHRPAVPQPDLPSTKQVPSESQADFSLRGQIPLPSSKQVSSESQTDFSLRGQIPLPSAEQISSGFQMDFSASEAAQTFSYAPPAGFSQGIEYTKEMIDAALAADSRAAALQIVPEQDASGHGTNVLGIAAGNGTASGGRYRGMAPQASLLVVKLGNPEEGGFPRTAEVMQAVEYVIRKAQELGMPAAVNLSFGNTYGSHLGTSLLETYLNMMADRWKTVIVAGTGNEGNSAGHFSANLETWTGPGSASETGILTSAEVIPPDRTQTLIRSLDADGIVPPTRTQTPIPSLDTAGAVPQDQTQTLIPSLGADGTVPPIRTPTSVCSLAAADIDPLNWTQTPAKPTSPLTVEFAISDYEPTMNLQLWKNYADEFLVTLTHPNGESAGPFGRETQAGKNISNLDSEDSPTSAKNVPPAPGSEPRPRQNDPVTSRYRLGNTELLVYYGQPSPYQGRQEIYFEFLPADTYLDSGIWKLTIEPRRIVSGEFDIWMPDSRARNEATRFLRPTPDTTLTIPSTASRLIAVGAYDSRRMTYASFSGRGRKTEPFCIRPDLVAPGVDLTTTAPGGGYTTVSGTSLAAPFVTGAAALLMEWGIVKGNDPYLYGEKLRASLNRGARQLAAERVYPNPRIGYGALCVRDSLPK